MFVFFVRGRLPWQTRTKNAGPADEFESLQQIYEMKLRTPIADLCQGMPSTYVYMGQVTY